MSNFAVKSTRIAAIEPIQGADVIELAVIGDYRSVVKKGVFKAGDPVAYIPEGAVLPDWLIDKMALGGRLAGPEKNRVRAIKLRGHLSQGLVYGLSDGQYSGVSRADIEEGKDLKDILQITKYEAPIPAYMDGEVYNAGTENTMSYDIENFKAYPDILQDGEEVVITEKLHGTFCGVGILPESQWDDKHINGKFVIFSKGLGGKGLCFKDNERNRNNVYFRAAAIDRVFKILEAIADVNYARPVPAFVLGEVFGKGVQDLTYATNEIQFRVFDIVAGHRAYRDYCSFDNLQTFCDDYGFQTVPLLYQGPFSKAKLLEYTRGSESVSGKNTHMREGVVVRPLEERRDDSIGRVILKSVSEDYLLRNGGTEFN